MIAADSGSKILLVDDETSLLEVLKIALQEAGYFVDCATNGQEGLTMFRQSSWDLVISDRAMPEMDGEAMAIEMKNSNRSVPMVMITGLPNSVKRPEIFDAVLAKPFGIVELLACVSQTIRPRNACANRKAECRLLRNSSSLSGGG